MFRYFQIISAIAVILSVGGQAVSAATPPWGMKLNEYYTALDRVIADGQKAKEGTTIQSCQSFKGSVMCRFDNNMFIRTRHKLEKIGIASGDEEQHLALIVKTPDGTVHDIAVLGTQGDPINFVMFLNIVYSVFDSIDPKILAKEADWVRISKSLGLLGSDDSPSAGQVQTVTGSWGTAACRSDPVSGDAMMMCVFSPNKVATLN